MLLHAGTKLWVYCTNNHQEILNGKPDPWECHEWGRSVWNQPKKKRWYREEESPVMVRKTTEEALIVRRSGESGGVKGRWERQELQSFPAACWHTHWRQGYDPSGFHFLSLPSRFIISRRLSPYRAPTSPADIWWQFQITQWKTPAQLSTEFVCGYKSKESWGGALA